MRLIDADKLLEQIDIERRYLIGRGQIGAEHILVHSFRDLVLNAPTVELNEHMCDLISKQAVIDRINKQREHLRPDIDTRDFIANYAYKICIEFIERMPSAQPEQRWIPVTERLPDKDGLYLVTTSKGQVQIHVFSHNGNSEECWMRCNKAWMPLPKPYEEEK